MSKSMFITNIFSIFYCSDSQSSEDRFENSYIISYDNKGKTHQNSVSI